jgi:hypothetical protein
VTCAPKISAHVNGGPSGGFSVFSPRSEDPQWCEQNLFIEGDGLGANVDSLMTNTDEAKKSLCEKILTIFHEDSFETLIYFVEGVEKVIVLMVINLCFPTLRTRCQSMCEVPLESFKTVTKIEQYAKAIETFGVTRDLLGRLFVLGTTGAGKSSFMRTLQSYGQNPKRPKRCLTGIGTNQEFKETKFLELIEDVKLSGNAKINIEDDSSKHIKNLTTEQSLDKKQAFGKFDTMTNWLGNIKIPHNSAHKVGLKNSDGKNVTVTVTDFGGHTEYLLSCKLFFKSRYLQYKYWNFCE